jgi:hypothetical protein
MAMDKSRLPGLIFWPEKKVRHAFREAGEAMGTKGEALAMRVFHRRMQYFLKTSSDTELVDPEENLFTIARYERPILKADIAKLRYGACQFAEGCKNGGTEGT